MRRSIALVSSVAVAAGVLLAYGIAAAAGFHESPEDFESDPRPRDWESTTPTGGEGNAWTAEDAFSGGRSIRLVDGAWLSPRTAVRPQSYYEIVHAARAFAPGFYGPSTKATVPYETDGAWTVERSAFRAERSEVRVVFAPAVDGGTGAPVYIDDVALRPISRDEAATLLDTRWESMPPSDAIAVPPADLRFLRRTARGLSLGRPLRIVLLGDSIVDDTSHSYFEVLVERMYPGTRIEVITSTRGSTGAWWFREVEPGTGIPRVRTWVTDHRPDLVLFGGISHGAEGLDHEIDSIRDVLRQVRRRLPATEFVLMTEIAGANDPRSRPGISEPFDPDGDDWRARLYRLSREERAAFVDMTRPWAGYILDTGVDAEYLMRDDVHMNARGSQVAGRILESFFARLSADRRTTRPTASRRDRSRPAEGRIDP